MAQSAAIDIIRRERRYHKRYRPLAPEYDPPAGEEATVDEDGWSKEKKRQLKDLDDIIEHKLKGLQQAVAKADLAAGGLADAGRLAELHNTSMESIYVTRHNVRERIKKEMRELEQHRERNRGKK
jgi:DNA-directed RNA polymerase specialized sigma24 family protein